MRDFILLGLFLGIFSGPGVEAKPTKGADDEPVGIRHVKDSEVKDVVDALTKLVEKLPLADFEGDHTLEQHVDKLNDYTSYKLPGAGRRGKSLYERTLNDLEKEAVVLRPSEDKISVRKTKKTYVGLRRVNPDQNRYFVFFIYVRDPAENEEGAVDLGSQKKIVEFDSWLNRGDKVEALERAFGWNECSSSIFVPCKTTDRSGLVPPRKDKKKKATKDGKKDHEPKKAAKKGGEIKTEEGFDANENVDFFWDLEDDIQKARFIGAGVNIMAGGSAGISGAISGLLGAVPGIGPLLSGITSGLGGLVTGVIGGVGGAVSGLLDGGLKVGLDLAGGGAGGMLGGLLGGGGGGGEGGGGLLGGLLGGGGGGGGGDGLTSRSGGGGGGGMGAGLGVGLNLLGGMGTAATGMMGGMMGQGSNLLSLGLNMGGALGGGAGGGGGMLGGLLGGAGGEGGGGMLGGLLGGAGGGLGGLGGLVGGIVQGGLGLVTGLVSGVLNAGIGLVNSLGIFGGLGTANARPEEVGDSVGIDNVDQGINDLPDDDEEEARQEFTHQESGGLGGLIGLDLELGDNGGGNGDGGGGGGGGGGGEANAEGEAESEAADSPKAEETAADGEEATAVEGAAEEGATEASADEAVTEAAKRKRSDDQTKKPHLTLQQARVIQLAVLAKVAQELDDMLDEEMGKTDLHAHPGWKTMDEAGRPNLTLAHEADAFVGFGSCIYKQASRADFEGATTPEEVIFVIATALRTQCVKREIKFYDELIADGVLKMNPDKTFDIPADSKLLKADKLSPRSRSELSRAFEMSAFSKAYRAELYNDAPAIPPYNSTMSRSVFVLGQTIVHGIELARSTLKHHEIKLLRGLATTTKTAFMKLLQDYDATKDCGSCKLDIEVTREDQKHLMTLMQFILHGLSPLDKKSETVAEALQFFTTVNSEVIQERVEAYLS